MTSGLTYRSAGVDIDAGKAFAAEILRHLKTTYGPEVIDNEGGFAGVPTRTPTRRMFQIRVRVGVRANDQHVGLNDSLSA